MARMLLLFHIQDQPSALHAARALLGCGVQVRGLGPTAAAGEPNDEEFEDDLRRVRASDAVIVLHSDAAACDFRIQHAVGGAWEAKVPLGVLAAASTACEAPLATALLHGPTDASPEQWRQFVSSLMGVALPHAPPRLRVVVPDDADPELAALRRIEQAARDPAPPMPQPVVAAPAPTSRLRWALTAALVLSVGAASFAGVRAARQQDVAEGTEEADPGEVGEPAAADEAEEPAIPPTLAAAPTSEQPPQIPPPAGMHASPVDGQFLADAVAPVAPRHATALTTASASAARPSRAAPQPARAPERAAAAAEPTQTAADGVSAVRPAARPASRPAAPVAPSDVALDLRHAIGREGPDSGALLR